MSDTKKVTDDPSGPDDKGAMEKQMQHVQIIKGGEVLGHQGEAREEHSGQNSPRKTPGETGDLADNAEKQLPANVKEGLKNQ